MKNEHLIRPHTFRLVALTFSLLLLMGCSAPESEGWVDTILCWLRPSCLPSQPPPVKPVTPEPTLPQSKDTRPQAAAPSKPPITKCLAPQKSTGEAAKSDINISYSEPTTKANGKALNNLAYTTIYYDLGYGREDYLDCRATNPQGGGKIPEGGGKIPFRIAEGTSIQGKICITATNETGKEGEPICKFIKR